MFLPKPINLLDIVISISSAIDHMDPRIADHHTTVAYIANQIGRELGLPQKTQYDLVLAGLLHDIGMLSMPGNQRMLELDAAPEDNRHGEIGYQLLKKFRHFSTVANIIRHHHHHWHTGKVTTILPESALLSLADEVDRLIDKQQPILEQVDHIVASIARRTGEAFHPEHVDAFTELAWKEHFWLDIDSPSLSTVLINNCSTYSVELDGDDLLDFAEMFAHVIDFRCHFTATHSSGVATVASILAHLVGFSATECQKMQMAGYLHDIGKLAVPQDILEKPSRLTSAEYRIIKSHAYYTYRILEPLHGLEDIRTWAAMHHERLDGYGYPGRCKAHQLPLGARIMAVADVFTALLETRPYRARLDKDEVVERLEALALRRALDANLVKLLLAHFDTIDNYRERAQEAAAAEYAQFLHSVKSAVQPSLASA